MKNLVAVLMLVGLVGCSKPEAKKDECWTDGKGATKTCLPKPSSVDLTSDLTNVGDTITYDGTLSAHYLPMTITVDGDKVPGGRAIVLCDPVFDAKGKWTPHVKNCKLQNGGTLEEVVNAMTDLRDIERQQFKESQDVPSFKALTTADTPPAPPYGAYNFILPAKIPGNGIYKCRVRSHVLEFVDLPKESK